MLYVPVGDAQQQARAQDVSALNGKILRLGLDGSVPDDNPFPGSPVWSYGHRNVQGMAWAADGTMFASEFGADTWDELNVIAPGANYGWPIVEGAAGRDGFLDPVQQWPTSEASPSGLARIEGSLFLANLRGRVLRSIPVADPTTGEVVFDGYGRIRDAVAAPDGSLWFVTNNTDGRGSPGAGDDRIVRVQVG
jgi:glucose/arabinose dehydrogenase